MSEVLAFGSLSDLIIIDLTQMLAGPFATMMLADHGAKVIKIESASGDLSRVVGPFPPDHDSKTHGGYFQSINRNKRSVVLDLKSADGKAALIQLVKSADAVIENFRVGVMDGLGLGYETLREVNPRIVYGAVTGFGDPRTGKSPYASWPAFDVVAQAMGGIMSITGPAPDTPTKIGPGIGDIIPGMFLAFGTLAAIQHARRTGRGQYLDVSMVDSILAVCERIVYQHSIQGLNPAPEGNHHPFMSPFGIYPAKDGSVALGAAQDSFFEILCHELEIPHLLEDPRFATQAARGLNKNAVIPLLSAATVRFSKAELAERLGGKIAFSPLLGIAEISQDEHFSARQMIAEVEQPGSSNPMRVAGTPIKMTETPGGVRRRGPYLGEDTRDVLRDAGLDETVIERIIATTTKK